MPTDKTIAFQPDTNSSVPVLLASLFLYFYEKMEEISKARGTARYHT
jgi:hypothetical protein